MQVLELTPAVLDGLRTKRDPAADGLVARVRATDPDTPDRELIGVLMRQARAARAGGVARVAAGRNAAGAPATTKPAILDWLADPDALPAWARTEEARQRIQRGQQFFEDWSMPIAATLFCGSLPAAYAAADGALVLQRCSDLAGSNVNRRVAETGQMLLDVMNLAAGPPRSLEPGGQGYISARGVRLLHAIIRFGITHQGDWDVGAHGQPINQEDLLGTLLTFTTVVFRGLDRLGLPFEAGAADDYLFTWCVIGHLLGIDDTLLPLERGQAEQLMATIASSQLRASAAGVELMAALLREMEESMPWGLRKLPRALVRHLLDDDVAALLQVPPTWFWPRVFDEAERVDRVLAALPFGSQVLQMASEVVGQSMIRLYLDRTNPDGRAPFRVDAPALIEAVGATSAPRRVLRRTRHACRRTAVAARRVVARGPRSHAAGPSRRGADRPGGGAPR